MKRAASSFQDYIDIARRRIWWLVLPIVLVTLSVFFGSLWLPRSYLSEATIMIEPQKVPSNYVQSTISEDVTDRLQAIRQEILSRGRLRKIIAEFNLYNSVSGKMAGDEVVELMRRDITVEVVTNQLNNTDHSKSVAAFKIGYSGRNPVLVQKVTRNLASLFIEENLKDREQESEGTTDFLDDQLEKLRTSLQEQEKRIQAFKSAHAGELPEQQVPSLQMLGQLQSVLQANSDAITRAQQQRSYMASVLESMSMINTPQSMKSALQLQYDNKTADLLASQQKYKPTHPDIQRLKAELAAIKEQIDSEKGKSWGDGRSQASPDQIQVELAGLDKEIQKRTARQSQLEADIQKLQLHMSALPHVEQQLAELSRDYDTSRTSYQALLSKRNNSSVAAEMERRAEGEQFRILDPASYPEKPYKPNLLQIDVLGLLIGVFAGCGLAMLVEMSDNTLHSESDFIQAISAPVLANLPYVLDPSEKRKVTARWWLIAAGTCVSCLAVVLIAYFQRSAIATGFGWRF
jgi:polysaccharide chain length determinant protein (PEP-CTERM system associated)